jgi:biopolymer transport protein ExbB
MINVIGMKKKCFVFILLLTLIPSLSWAWWNKDWGSRKQITADGSVTGADIQETLADFPLLIRLHTGNFGFFTELGENGKDLRFMADDKTPLKHHVEKIDAINELGLIWVKVPKYRGAISTDSFWMYYGNKNAPDGSDSKGIYDVSQALTFHFAEGETLHQDATAYGNNASESSAVIDPAGWIGAAAKFNGNAHIDVKASPAMAITPETGWSFSAWVRVDAAQPAGTLMLAQDGPNMISLEVNGLGIVGRYIGPGSTGAAQTPAATLQAAKWQHLALVASKDKLELFLDGQSVGTVPIALAPMNPSLFIGGSDTKPGLVGMLDEVQVAKIARTPDWIKLSYRSQSPDFTVFNFGEDESSGSAEGPNYFIIILQSLTVDGMVVIALCGVMFIIAALVIVLKAMMLSRANKQNRAFLDQYHGLSGDADPTSLDHEETEEEKEAADSDVLAAISGGDGHFQGSPIFHIYHAGVQELKKRLSGPNANKPLSPEAMEVLRARLDSAVVREGQKLNRNMVLLTIAISGGPFLGLLGTVLGVMITFAVIAATGDVNINSIAPGISGALLATVAGLAVAIPALFGYNYLLTQIKDITAEMKVFTDEFLSMTAERLAEQHRNAIPATSGQLEG